jgi:predicted secreted hydrolase
MIRTRRRKQRLAGAVLTSIAFMVAVAGSQSDTGEWQQAIASRTWKFPEDHGAHPAFRTEWWYFTGNLSGRDGARYGYQLTFFREGVRFVPEHPENPWSVRDLFLAHLTVTDVSRGTFQAEDLLSRSGPKLAGALSGKMDVHVLGWSARMTDGVIYLEARRNGLELELELTPRKPAVLHGHKGLSLKGPGAGEASYYVSFTDLETRGTITTCRGGRRITASGTSWFDHEFGSNMLAEDQAGWDWFGLHLSDGRDLMVYFLRGTDGSTETTSSGTLVEPGGRTIHLEHAEISLNILDRWRSPRSGAVYPCRWRLAVPAAGIELVVSPLLPDQELLTSSLPDLIYWEGAVAGEGTSGGRRVGCEGYAELTGYAGNFRGIFQ